MAIPSKNQEYALVVTLVAGLVATIVGVGFIAWNNTSFPPGVAVLAAGVAATATSITLGFPVLHFHHLGARTTGGTRYERMRRWNRVKVSSVLLNLLLILGTLVLAAAVLSRTGVIDVRLHVIGVHRALGVLVLGIVGSAAYAHYQSLRIDLKADRSGSTRIITFTALQAAVAFSALGVYLAYRTTPLSLVVTLEPGDAIVLLLTSTVLVGAVTMVARGLPTLYVLVSDEQSAYLGRDYASRQKSVVMPTLVAFTLLFVFLMLMILFGAGAVGALQQVTTNRSILLVLLLIVFAAVAGLSMSLVIARQEDRIVLYHTKTPREKQQELVLVALSAVVTLFLGASAFLLFRDTHVFGLPQHRWLDLAAFALMGAVGPYGFYAAHKHKRIRDMEQRFPDFLRDLASSHKGGLTLVQSVHVAARGQYGSLTPEVKKMSDQLSWNVSFEEAFARFAERVNTPLAQRTISLILEAGRSGGSTTDILLAAARDARELKTLERQRHLSMSVYTTVIYVTFFVFLFVVGVLYDRFVPQILSAGQASAQSSLGDVGLSLTGVTLEQYRTFYFSAAAVQAIGNGMMAGLMGSGKGLLGLRHAFIMILATYIAFAFIMGV